MKKRDRVVRQGDFQRLLGSPRIYSGRALVAFATRRADTESRVGVAVSRQVKGAVARNRLRRRLREVARRGLLGPDSPLRARGIGFDVILIGRAAALAAGQHLLEAETAAVVDRLLRWST